MEFAYFQKFFGSVCAFRAICFSYSRRVDLVTDLTLFLHWQYWRYLLISLVSIYRVHNLFLRLFNLRKALSIGALLCLLSEEYLEPGTQDSTAFSRIVLNNLNCWSASPTSQQETAKDLGICTDSSLKFSSHISQIVAKADTRACVIHKCFLSKNRNILVKAYVTYVRPLLKYAVCVWSPYQLLMILLRLNLYNDALQSGFLDCLMLATVIDYRYWALEVSSCADSIKILFTRIK